MASLLVRDRLWTAAWCAVALAFPWSNAFMSVATGFLGLVALIECAKPIGRAPERRYYLWSGWALVAVVLLSALSSAWSRDSWMALDDARIKLPLLVGGVALLSGRGGTVLPHYASRVILKCAVVSAGLATLSLVFLDVLDGAPYGGRHASRFISHIRFGLWWVVLLPWASKWLSRTEALVVLGLAMLTWFWTESLSGLLCGLWTAGFWAPMLWKGGLNRVPIWPESWTALRRLIAASALIATAVLALRSALPSEYPRAESLPAVTADGSEYVHYLQRRVKENGHFVWIEIAWGELAESWKERHEIPFEEVKGRLIRFLASKGLTKDRTGVQALSKEEVQAVAEGATSFVAWKGLGWTKRWNQMQFNWGQWLDGERTGNASVLARSVYQGAAWDAIGNLPATAHVIGLGSGGSKSAMQAVYEQGFPDWPEHMRHRPHNQWLSMWLQLGWLGLVLVVASCLAALRCPWGLPGVVILWVSFLFEDTLETQAGVTLAIWVLVLSALMPSDRPD